MCVDNGVKETAVRLGQPETGGDNEPKCRNAAAGAAGSRITSVSTVRSSWNVDEETRHISVRIVTGCFCSIHQSELTCTRLFVLRHLGY